MKKLKGLFGFKFKDKFEEEKFKIISTHQEHEYDGFGELVENEIQYEIENPPIPNEMFSEYWIGCSSVDKTITSIGANISQKSYPIYEPQGLLKDLSRYFVNTYWKTYAIDWDYEDRKIRNDRNEKNGLKLNDDKYLIGKYTFEFIPLINSKAFEQDQNDKVLNLIKNKTRLFPHENPEENIIYLIISLDGNEGKLINIGVEMMLGGIDYLYSPVDPVHKDPILEEDIKSGILGEGKELDDTSGL